MMAEYRQSIYQFLSGIDGQKVVRISTEDGSDFIYIGKACDFNMTALDKEIKTWHMKNVIHADEALRRAKSSTDIERRKTILLKHIDNCLKRKALIARIVVDVSQGILESNHLRIRIEGCEGWVKYEPEIPPLEKLNQDGAKNLVAAIYKQAADDLVCGHQLKKNRLEDKRKLGWRIIKECRTFFRNDPYGQLNDPEWLIEECERRRRRV